MSEAYIGEIRLFAGHFAPRGWAFCDGSLLAISQNTALFSLLGTYYGGNGKTNFALPDLRGRVPIQHGAGPGLTQRYLGENGGANYFTMTTSQMPAHTHTVTGTSSAANVAVPTTAARFGNAPGGRGQQGPPMYNSQAPNTPLAPQTISLTGAFNPISLTKPVLVLNFIIALTGNFPPHP
jgi:microcystin-dependent protein